MIDLTHQQRAAETAVASTRGALGALQSIPIDSPERVQWIVDVGRDARLQRLAIERECNGAVGPLKTALATVQGWFREPVRELKAIEAYAKQVSLEYQAREHAAAAAAVAEVARQAAPEVMAAEVQAAAAALVPRAPDGLGSRTDWTWEVADRAAIPLEYYVLDEARISREARALKDKLQIPGIRPVPKVVGVFR